MIISTVLRLMRGAAKASLKAGKFAINTSGKLVKTGARTVKHARMSPEEKRTAKKKEKHKDKTKKAVKKTGETAVKVTGHVISEGFILLVGIIEDIGVLLLVMLLILAIMLVTIISVLGGVFGSVIGTDGLSVSVAATGTGFWSGGSSAGSADGYDWWGNKDKNLLLLTEDKDKEIYQLIACNAELQKFAKNDTSNKKLWNMYVGIGLLASEMGGGLYTSSMGMHDGSQEEKNAIINDKCNYVFAYHAFGSGDGLGDGPVGLTWDYASKDGNYEFGPFKIANVNKSYLNDNISKSGRGYNEAQAYAQWTLPGGLKYSYDCSYEYSFDSKVNYETGETIGNIFDRWGIEKTEDNLVKIGVTDYYAKHHGCGDVDRAYVLEYMCALYKYADNSLGNIGYVNSSGEYSSTFITGGHGHMMEFLENTVSMSESSSNIQVIHDGKKIVYDYENGNTLAKGVLAWAKQNNSEGYNKLKTALDWAAVGAPEYRAGGTGYNFSAFRSNLVACMGVYFSGQTIVNYMVNKLGIDINASSSDNNESGSSNSGTEVVNIDKLVDDLYTKTKSYAYGGRNKNGISDSKQAVEVNFTGGDSCIITAYERTTGGWKVNSKIANGVNGHVGTGGIGDTDETQSKTPEGTYYLGQGFGVPMSNLNIDWTDVQNKQYCWGGSNSGNAHPNEMYKGSKVSNSDEDLTAYCKSGSYTYSVFIEYNSGTNYKQGQGSAFFLHVGSKGTAGCVSADSDTIKKIVCWLDKGKKPIIIIHGSDYTTNKYTETVKTGLSSSSNKANSTGKSKNDYTWSKFKNMGILEGWYKKNGLTSYLDGKVTDKISYYGHDALPGLDGTVPGMHAEDGFMVDGDGYIVLAAHKDMRSAHTIIPTPFGRDGKVYDTCPEGNIDVYVEKQN